MSESATTLLMSGIWSTSGENKRNLRWLVISAKDAKDSRFPKNCLSKIKADKPQNLSVVNSCPVRLLRGLITRQ